MIKDRALQPLRGEARLAARQERRQHKAPPGKLVSPFVVGGEFKVLTIGGLYGAFYVPLESTLSKVSIKAKQWPFYQEDKFIWEIRIIGETDTQTRFLTMMEPTQEFELTKQLTGPSMVELSLVRVETEDEAALEVSPLSLGIWATMVFYPNPCACRTLGGHDESSS